MKKVTFAVIIAFPIVQILLAALKLFGVIGFRWLWVLTPLWLFICGFALYGIYVSLKGNTERSAQSDDHKDGDNKNEENK